MPWMQEGTEAGWGDEPAPLTRAYSPRKTQRDVFNSTEGEKPPGKQQRGGQEQLCPPSPLDPKAPGFRSQLLPLLPFASCKAQKGGG